MTMALPDDAGKPLRELRLLRAGKGSPALASPAFLTRVMVCAALSGRQGRRAAQRIARCGASGKRLDAACRPDSAALRVAPRRPPASSRASSVATATLEAHSLRIERLEATQTVTLVRNAG